MLDRIAGGDRNAVEELLARYRRYLRRIIDLRMDDRLRNRVDPSDVVQETQLEVAKRMQEYLRRRPASLRLWLRRTAIDNLARLERYHLAAQKRAVSREYPLPEQSSVILARQFVTGQPIDVLIRREDADRMRTAIDALADMDREIVLLRHVEELSNAETAELLGLDMSAASKRYGRALRRLREKFQELDVSRS